ncbi:putative ribonuclease H-like domain-containing protein [Tanacetum coccineum]
MNVDGKLIGKDEKGIKSVSFTSIFKDNIPKKTVKLCALCNEKSVEGADVAIPLAAVHEWQSDEEEREEWGEVEEDAAFSAGDRTNGKQVFRRPNSNAEADINNLETTISVNPIPITIIHKDHPKAQIIREVDSAVQTRRILICTDIAKITRKWSKPGKHRHGKGKSTQEPGVSSKVGTKEDLPHGKKAIGTKWVFRNKKDQRGIVVRNKARPVAQGYRQEEGVDYDKVFAPVARIEASGLQLEQRKDDIFLSQDKYVFDILKKFGLSSVKTTSTPMETHKPLSKDADGTDVDVHLYRSMIGSLMYLTSSRPDIMFAVCACSRFQVQPKASHMHAVKIIFRYLKGHPTLGLWYPKDSPLLGS